MLSALRKNWDLFGAGLVIATWGTLMLLPGDNVLRLAGGLVISLFLPGYLFLAGLEGERSPWGRSRAACAAPALSVGIVASLGILLAVFSWVRLYGAGPLLFGWNVGWLVAASCRRARSAHMTELRDPGYPKSRPFRAEQSRQWGSAVGLLAAVILVAFASWRLIVRSIVSGPAFTEFFVVGTDEEAGVGLYQVDPGQLVSVTVGIVNREGESLRYRVEACFDRGHCQPPREVVVADEAEVHVLVAAPAPEVTGPARIVVRLSRRDRPGPYRQVHAWIQVR